MMTSLVRNREQTFWTFQCMGWAGYACLRIFHGLTIDWGFNYFDTTAVATATGFFLSTVLRYVYRPLRKRSLPVVMTAVVFFCPVFAMIFSAIEVTAGTLYDPGGLLNLGLFENAMFDAFVLLAWSALYFGFNYYEQLQAQREATLKASAMAHEAQLQMLRYQLNPHFLFNTLNAISSLVLLKEAKLADRMLNKLAAFLRYTLVHEPDQHVTLEQELYAIGLYLEIEKVRFEDRLTTILHIEDDALHVLVPSLLLQPLIENAIKYAVAPRVEGGVITISAQVKEDRLIICLSDDGPGIGFATPQAANPGSSGVGLRNIRARLIEVYGNRHGFYLSNRPEGGLSVEIIIPCERRAIDKREETADDRNYSGRSG